MFVVDRQFILYLGLRLRDHLVEKNFEVHFLCTSFATLYTHILVGDVVSQVQATSQLGQSATNSGVEPPNSNSEYGHHDKHILLRE